MQHQKQAQAKDNKADTMDSLNTIPHYVCHRRYCSALDSCFIV